MGVCLPNPFNYTLTFSTFHLKGHYNFLYKDEDDFFAGEYGFSLNLQIDQLTGYVVFK